LKIRPGDPEIVPHGGAAVEVLFEPCRIGQVAIGNRFVRAGTAEGMVDRRNLATGDLARMLGELARLGVGLIVTGHMFVDRRGQYADDQTAIDTDEAIGALEAVVAAVHRHGGKIFAQLSHAGSQSLAVGTRPIAPSDVPNMMTGREVPAATSGEIEATVEAFGAAARRAVAAGFDGVHLHAANGYLISQFSSPLTNRREDAWGGAAERRDRFAIEVTRRIRAELPPARALSVKLGCVDIMAGGLGIDESIRRARLLVAAGADAFEVSCNLMTSYADNIVPYVALTRRRAWADLLPHRLLHAPAAEAYYRWIAQALRPEVQVPLVLGGGIRSMSTMADIVDSGDADFVALARPFIREPGLVRRIEHGLRGTAGCTSCNICIMHSGHHPLQCWRIPRSRLVRHAWFRATGGFRGGIGSGQKPRTPTNQA
jgi:2,4-dienoyl-CoA reductase-like NADH-dependent reductase (Old Yellow Enzyme family)